MAWVARTSVAHLAMQFVQVDSGLPEIGIVNCPVGYRCVRREPASSVESNPND